MNTRKKPVDGDGNMSTDEMKVALSGDLPDGLGQDVISDDDQIASVLRALTDDDETEISICEIDGRKRPYLFSWNPADMSLRELKEFLRDEYGGGEFSVEIRKNGQFLTRRSLSIKSRVKKVVVPRETMAGEGGSLADVLRAVQESSAAAQAQTRELMLTMMQKQSENMVDMMKTMISREPSQTSLDVVQLLGVAKEMFGGKDQSVNLLLKGIELANTLGGKGSGDQDSSLGDIVKTLGAPLVEITKALAGRQQVALPGVGEYVEQQNQIAAASDEQVGSVVEGENVGMMQQAMLNAAVGMFVRAAEKGSDPAAYAQIFVDQYGDAVPDDLILEEDKFLALVRSQPSAIPHEAWFLEVRRVAMGLMFEDDEAGENAQ